MFHARPTISSVPAGRTRILAQIAIIVFALPATGSVCAQAIDYTVQIDAPGRLDDLLEDNLDLVRWRGNPRLDLEQLQRLVKDAPEQARTLIATEGYYSPKVSAGLDTSTTVPVARVIVDPGEPVLVGDVDLVLRGFEPLSAGSKPFDPATLRNNWTLNVGERFRQADWEAAKRNLLRQVMQTRYPRAQLAETSATVDPDVRRALLHVVVDSGPEVRLGDLRIEGLSRYPERIVTNLNQIKRGDEYSEAALQSFQARLQDTGYFSTVEVSADSAAALEENIEELKEQQQGAPAAKPSGPEVLPVLVRVTENKRRNASVGLGYSTNTGARAQVNYDDLNVYGLRMKSQVIAETKRQAARADFYLPTTAKGYNDSFGAGFERNDLRGEITNVATVAVRRAWGTPLLERSLTFEYLSEKQTVEGQLSRNSKSLPLTYSITRRELDNLVLPTRGYVINAQLGGALLPVLTDERFVRAYTRFVNYRPISVDSTLILRAEAGALGSKDKRGVPGTFLFRAGGDQSVRGYGYQQLGVEEGEAVVGGRYLLTGGVEYQYWFKPPWGVAVFVDAGNAADRFKDLKPEFGYGIGARWRSPVGPINVDLAYGQAVKEARLHFSVGFTF
ncbi:outer membrane protein assembly factor [Massilia sp. RP-1-19]|uniref:Outer membrane protein assembly factor n=1 Tax=Massilia polaris TaxID=2728846 RepID=A0A848HRK0_9BURK|nr:outer membrane protein assembly factor [Massilia polaris]